MKKLLIAIASLFLFTTPAFANTPCSDMVYNGVFPKANEPVTIICHKRYVVGFSTARHTPLWVAEKLTADEVAHENVPRKDNFRPDPAVPANQQGSTKAYIGTGYDKGHMNNYEDVADDAVAGDESFFMTNMVPQKSQNNRGIWRSLEDHVRKLATAKGTIYVVTGPIFDGKPATLKDGTPVPTRLFKMVISPSTKEAITVVMPNANGMPASTLPMYNSTVHNLRVTDTLVDVLPNDPKFNDRKLP